MLATLTRPFQTEVDTGRGIVASQGECLKLDAIYLFLKGLQREIVTNYLS